jgi:hypothetical protein
MGGFYSVINKYQTYTDKKYIKKFKWYEQVHRFLFHQAYWSMRLLQSKNETKRELILNSTKTIIISSIIFTINAIASWGIVELFKLIIKIKSAFQ